jgi:hypothetical protein
LKKYIYDDLDFGRYEEFIPVSEFKKIIELNLGTSLDH